MLPHEFVAARNQTPVCYSAYGLAEPHGPYNALGLDWLKATALVERAAQQHGGIVAPPFAWHITDIPEFHDDGQGRGWFCDVGIRQSLASSIPADLFYRTALYQIRAMDARNFHAAILVTGHYGGLEQDMRKLCEFYLRRTGSPLRLAALADNETIDPNLPYRGDHAGVCETSQLLALHPALVDLAQRTVPAELGTRFAGSVNFQNGPLPTTAIGQAIVDSQVRNLGAIATRLLADYRPQPNWRAPDLNQTEIIWRDFEQLTRPHWVCSRTYADYRTGKPHHFPSWDQLDPC